MSEQAAGHELRHHEQQRDAMLADRCHRLIRFLREIALRQAPRVSTVDDHPVVVWLDDLPDGLSLFERASAGEVVLEVPAAASIPSPPVLPARLAGWVVMPEPGEPPEEFPPLREIGLLPRLERRPDGLNRQVADTTRLVDAPDVQAAYEQWLPTWRIWAARARADAARRTLHNVLHGVAQRLAQEGDALELVLGTGLLSWQITGSGTLNGPATPDRGPEVVVIRHHLLATKLLVDVDAATSAIRLRLPAEASTRLEDGGLLDGVRMFRPERTNALHERLQGSRAVPLGSDGEGVLRDWLALAVDVPTDGYSPSWRPTAEPGPRPQVTFAPALLLRTRSRAALLNYYDQMLDALRGAGRPPLGLVQLVETLEADERLAWLAAGSVSGDVRPGTDPLFPLSANPEQARVMERLRHDSGVVVEGPPGTGKTHTIANLTSALLAQGQRVLVTSQKAQALRVLREKLPPALQRLCVSLTDAGDTGSSELAASIGALAAEKASYHPDDHDRRIAQITARRDAAVVRRAELGERIQRLRTAEGAHHGADDVPRGWEGTIARIARGVRDGYASHGWVPTPVPGAGGGNTSDHDPGHGPAGPPPAPLDAAEAAELLAGLRSRTPERARRVTQILPEPSLIVPTGTIRELLAAERAATTDARTGESLLDGPATVLADRLLGRLSPAQVGMLRDAATALLDALDLASRHRDRWAWVGRALDDMLAGHGTVLWAKVASVAPVVAEAADALEQVGLRTVVLPALTEHGPASAGALQAGGQALRDHLAAGGGLRGVFRSKAQRGAALLLAETSVDGMSPRTTELLDVVLARLTAEIALDTAGRAWALVGVVVDPATAPEVRLARLHDLAAALDAVGRVCAARDHALDVVPGGVSGLTLADVRACRELTAATDVVLLRLRAAAATEDLRRIHSRYAAVSGAQAGPPELAALTDALAAHDIDAYEAARGALEAAIAERDTELRCVTLLERVRAAHPRLAALLAAGVGPETGGADRGTVGTAPDTPADVEGGMERDTGVDRDTTATQWERRMDAFGEAWAWACAATWLAGARGASGESDMEAELDAAEDAVAAATADLAGALAWKHCLDRMDAERSAALRAYADAVAAGGKFTGRYAERYRQAAREAMRVAQTAVPAWVMPISEVLSTVPAVRDCFDVVIVDEGSQAGLDSLFLLWLAPRVIVVGDDRQCTPTEATFEELEPVFHRLDTLLSDVPGWLRVAFTPRSSLFTLLRTRFGEVIRLREHFRCMPEIIEWSSAMFYRDAPLVPLRQFGADRLPPLRSRHVPDAVTSGVSGGLRNPAEADALVAQVLACADDPHYDGRSFGVVVLQGTAQAELIRSRLISRMPLAEQQRRRLRVGSPPDFQGDERDIIFLSMVVAPGTPTPSLTRLEYQRRFNVAASRARDQVWLFHSVTEDDLEPSDLRHSYLSYVRSRARGIPGESTDPHLTVPELSDVRTDIAHPRFDTLFEQRVFRFLRERGYLVWPQVEVNGRRIDLVVVGGRARLAVECDADPTLSDPTLSPSPARMSPERIAHEFARERELRRAGWRFWRIRQSDFEIDPDAAMASLWPALARAGVTPVAARSGSGSGGAAGTDIAPGAEAGAGAGDGTGVDDDRTLSGLDGRPGDGPDEMIAPSAGTRRRWVPIALSELEGLDDIPPRDTAAEQTTAPNDTMIYK